MTVIRNLLTSMWTWLLIAILIGTAAYLNMETDRRRRAQTPMPMVAVPETPFVATVRGLVEIEGGIMSLSAARTGTFKEVLVKEGEQVTEGQVLAIQEDRDEKIKLESVRINLEKAQISLEQRELDLNIKQRELERAKIQYDQDAISQQAYDNKVDAVKNSKLALRTQKIDLQQLETNLETAKFELAQRKLVAPANGRIITVNIRPGTGVTTNSISTAFELMPSTEKIVRVNVDDITIESIFLGQDVTIAKVSDRDEKFYGTVAWIAEAFSSSSNSGSPTIEVIIAAGDLPLKLGHPVLVQFVKPGEKSIEAISQ